MRHAAFLTFIIIIASCQKQTVLPEKTTQTESLVVGPALPPPVLYIWFAGPKLPLTDQIPGDVPVGLQNPQGFAINGKGYIFGGITETGNGESENIGNTLEYDTASRTWSQKASLPAGYSSIQSENFVIGNSAYICNGYDKQNWQYNQATNTWTRKSDIPSVARALGVGMSINGKGYIGLGTYQPAGSQNYADAADWWQYDPILDTWTRKSELPGGKREGAAGFVVNGKGYVCTGFNRVTKDYYTDCWQYDPIADSWNKKADFPGIGRTMCLGFSGAKAGYIATGNNMTTNIDYNDCYQYVPAQNTWYVLPQIGGGGRAGGAGFSIGSTLYVGGGFVNDPNSALSFWYFPYAG